MYIYVKPGIFFFKKNRKKSKKKTVLRLYFVVFKFYKKIPEISRFFDFAHSDITRQKSMFSSGKWVCMYHVFDILKNVNFNEKTCHFTDKNIDLDPENRKCRKFREFPGISGKFPGFPGFRDPDSPENTTKSTVLSVNTLFLPPCTRPRNL
jgi:hypothetical protein